MENNNLKVIGDIDMLTAYIDKFLVDDLRSERYFFTLRTRKKYVNSNHFKNDLDIKKGHTSRRYIVQSLQKLEVDINLYDDNGIIIEPNMTTISLYHNPRSVRKANKLTIKQLVDDIDTNKTAISIAQSCLQKSCSRKIYSIFDFDIEHNGENLTTIINMVETNIGNGVQYHIIETRGGYHLFIKLSTIRKPLNNKWYEYVVKSGLCGSQNVGDIASALVGTYQGGHLVRVIFSNW